MKKKNYDFNVGDEVIVTKHGSGVGYEDIGKIVTIVEQGGYLDQLGYIVNLPIGNSTHRFKPWYGFIAESSFKLVQKIEPQYEIY